MHLVHGLRKTCRIAIFLAIIGLITPAVAQDVDTVTSCPGTAKLPVTFQIDCSHLTDLATKQLCHPFKDATWPHPKGEGGLALNCAVDYLAQYSVKFRANSKLGPYDVHELLHEYQFALGALPSMHPLFASSMAEASRRIGDDEQYQRDIKQMRAESQRLHDELMAGKYASLPNQCSIAQTQVEESLYLENSRLLPMYYLKLPPSKGNSPAERDARFNRMFYVVSSARPEIKTFLTEHGCGPF